MGKTDFTISKLQISTVSATTAFKDISDNLIEFSGFEILAETEEAHGMGDAWAETAFTGLKRVSPITLTAFYDDATTSGFVALFGNATDPGAERVIKVSFGTTNAYPKTDVIVKRFNRKPSRGELTKCEVELIPTGAVTVVAT